MFKILTGLFVVSLVLILVPICQAANGNSFVTVVNPVRGEEFWDNQRQNPTTTLTGEIEVLKKLKINATWLIRYDALKNATIRAVLNSTLGTDEKGLFLEITPAWTKDAGVNYRESLNWHDAGSVFLAGYALDERKKLIDTAFTQFKNVYGSYPVSVGAWWIDSYALSYMQETYGVKAALIVADQYSTDNYQIWGQYWEAPYYPATTNALSPAQSLERKIPVVMTQWAARDPVNGYGKGVEESTLSVQPNDYIDYHNLGIDYFAKLVDIYTKQPLNQVNQLVIGLENSYSWQKYGPEYQKQMDALSQKQTQGQFALVTMSGFADWYNLKFPELSPQQVIVAHDPLNNQKEVVWFMNPYYRAGWSYTGNVSLFRDIRQYIDGSEELCLKTACKEINFATFATRVLDEVTYGNHWILDEGKISDLNISENNGLKITYKNQTGKLKSIELLTRDIAVDGKVSSIDTAILQATNETKNAQQNLAVDYFQQLSTGNNWPALILPGFEFLLFVMVAFILPGFLIIEVSFGKITNFALKTFLSIGSGIAVFTVIYYFASLLQIWWVIYLYLGLMLIVVFRKRLYREVEIKLSKRTLLIVSLILAGTIFQTLPVLASGSLTKSGVGFWGPNGHDGIWHLALVRQLQTIVPQNPIFAGEKLQNYHYFYDLLVSATNRISTVSPENLIFRFYPILFSLCFGIGTYFLQIKLFKSHLVAMIGMYLAYFAGSFGWIVEFLRERHFGGESAFWSNQPVSFNLNPPFAISLILLITFIYLLSLALDRKATGIKSSLLLIVILGSLVAFKAYAAVIAITAMAILAMFRLVKNKDLTMTLVFIGSAMLSLIILIPNYRLSSLAASSSLFIWSPFWFVHSMIDSPDRVGWTRLSLTRMVGLEQGNYLKFIGAETLGMFIFWAGNLGVRIFSFGLLGRVKLLVKEHTYLYLFLVTVFALSIPLLVIQAGNPWNAIQFFYYGLYTTALFTGVSLAAIFNKGIPGKVIVLIILIIAPINALVTSNSYLYPVPHTAVSYGEVTALNFLSGLPKGTVLTYPFDSTLKNNLPGPLPLPLYETSAYVSAFSGQQTYLEDLIQQNILQTDYKERVIYQSYFFKDLDDNKRKDFLSRNNIRYIYLPRIFNVSLPADKLNLQIVYQNQSAILYKVLD
ncbi:MAG: hypothetical protein Q7R49_04665 [Candidatus Daviesbacteria bacterium]|nr:hypothetical protein [Candidatus Daviesbacteria bacterium]